MDKMDKEQMRNMRWLYDDETSYQKAMRRIRLEQLKEQRDKAALRQARREQVEELKLTVVPVLERTLRHSRRLWVRYGRRMVRKVSRKQAILATAALAGVFLVLGGIRLSQGLLQKDTTAQLGKISGGAQASAKPEFAPAVKPSDSESSAIRYDKQKKVIVFPDSIKGAKVIVSQQPLPEEFLSDSSKFDDFLDNAIPKRQSVIFSGGTAYMSVEDDNNVQFSVFATPDILAFVRAEHPLDKASWQTYFSELKL